MHMFMGKMNHWILVYCNLVIICPIVRQTQLMWLMYGNEMSAESTINIARMMPIAYWCFMELFWSLAGFVRDDFAFDSVFGHIFGHTLKDWRCSEDSPSWNTWPLGLTCRSNPKKRVKGRQTAIEQHSNEFLTHKWAKSPYLNLFHIFIYIPFLSHWLRNSKWVLNVVALPAPNHLCLNPHGGSLFQGAQAQKNHR